MVDTYKVSIVDLESWFQVYTNGQGLSCYNINETVIIPPDSDSMSIFTPEHDMFWTTISYKLYETTHLAWLLMKVNMVDSKNIFDPVHAGQNVIYPEKEQVSEILHMMR